MVGHGLVTRQVRLLTVGGVVEDVEIQLRRYRCRDCGAVVRVAPRGVLTRRAYAMPAIVLALAWWALSGWSTLAVRVRLRPGERMGPTAAGQRWVTLLRWARAATSPSGPGDLRNRVALRLGALRRHLAGLGLGSLTPAQVVRAAHHAGENWLFANVPKGGPPMRIPQ
jgi:hypothetical protein